MNFIFFTKLKTTIISLVLRSLGNLYSHGAIVDCAKRDDILKYTLSSCHPEAI